MQREKKISANETNTKKRFKLISTYLEKNVCKDNKFICPNKTKCRKSHQGIFGKAQFHHIGKKYDLKMNDKELRIVIVGQEFGCEDNFITLEGNYKGKMENGEELEYKGRNPHMRGTTNVLRLLFGIGLGTDHESEYLTFENGKKHHFFDAFSLINYLLCSAIGNDKSMRGKSNSIMRNNCQIHFKNIINILEPTILIVQSKGYWKWIENSFVNIKSISKKLPLYIAEINGKNVYIASFSHPSCPNKYNWGNDDHTEYLLNTVKPTVNCILKKLGL